MPSFIFFFISFIKFIFLDFAICTWYIEDLFHERKFYFCYFVSLCKNFGMSSYGVTIAHYESILILLLFRFVANVQDLYWSNFIVLTINKERSYKDLFTIGKDDPLHLPSCPPPSQPLHRLTRAKNNPGFDNPG